jgi:NAD(P)-dependent dehydrogenase (short-subunit alcohol dehydrogenase family)
VSEIRFEGRVALVTGAGNGFGPQYAQLLAGRGARVVVHDLDPTAATHAAHEIEGRGGVAVANSARLDTPEGAKSAVDAAVDAFGGIDILVLQAAKSSDAGSTDALLADEKPEQVLSGLFEGYWLTRAAWIPMRERRYGRVVLVCPLGRPIADAMAVGNTVSNMGLVGVMNILKCEGPEYDLMVNMVAPTSDGDPAAVGDLAVYLAHEACRTTGEIFTVRADGLARMFMGVNAGFFDPGLTTEGVRDHLAEILDPRTFIVPDEAGQEIQQLLSPHLQ